MVASDVATAARRENYLELRGIEMSRDDRVLFSGLGLRVNAGEVVQIEGANGSGKTTLLRIICGLLTPDEGEIFWCGEDIRKIRPEYQQEVAYMGHVHGVKDDLTALENLRFGRALGNISREVPMVAALEHVGLAGYEHAAVRTFSAGMRRRLAMARLLVSGAAIWILDEPFTALDVHGVAMVEALLDQHTQAGGMVILSTHHPVTLKSAIKKPVYLSP